jgi:hypothetical protein
LKKSKDSFLEIFKKKNLKLHPICVYFHKKKNLKFKISTFKLLIFFFFKNEILKKLLELAFHFRVKNNFFLQIDFLKNLQLTLLK